MNQITSNEFLTGIELANRWKLEANTLRNWRSKGWGPKFSRIGRNVRYPIDAVLSFEQDSLVDSGRAV
jgi:hypothetical protein